MSNQTINDLTLNLLGMLARKITVPSGFHGRCAAVREMLDSDVSGVVDSLTDFQVNSATVDFGIEASNDELTKKLKKWLDRINLDYNGQVPTGIKPLAKEYFKERWKYSSFPVLKIAKWGMVDGIIVPTKAFFVDGQSLHAEDKNTDSKSRKLIDYDYYLGEGKTEKLSQTNSIITKPYGRWFEEYPDNYLIKRGVYQNWKILQALKNRETEILEQIIPYLLLIKKGSEGLAINKDKGYKDSELKQIIKDFQKQLKEFNEASSKVKTPTRATNFDEEIKHLIPDLKGIFDSTLFTSLEKHILSGLGFINPANFSQAPGQQSILNPKIFIEETKNGVKDFKQILKELIFKIEDKNKHKTKYMNSQFYVTSSPVNTFISDEFKRQVQRLWRSGRLSDQTAIEVVAEVDFETEVYRRKQEKKRDLPKTFYPPVADNREDKAYVKDFPKKKEPEDEDKRGIKVPEDKTDPQERKEYRVENKVLEISPYKKIEDLPKNVKTSLPKSLQRIWKKAFNNAYEQYDDDDTAFKVAWRVIKRIAEKKNGKWVRKKRTNKNGKEVSVRLTKKILNEVIDYTEERLLDEINEEDK